MTHPIVLGVLVVVVAAAVVVAWTTDPAPSNYLVNNGGVLVCGQLNTADDGKVALDVSKGATLVSVDSVMEVESCGPTP